MVQQLLFAIADKQKEEPDNMVLNETQEEHFDYHREDFCGGRGAHTESDKQESAGAKFTDCNATCNEVREELLTRKMLWSMTKLLLRKLVNGHLEMILFGVARFAA